MNNAAESGHESWLVRVHIIAIKEKFGSIRMCFRRYVIHEEGESNIFISDVTSSVTHLLFPEPEWRLLHRGVTLNYTPTCQTETFRPVHRSGSALTHGGSLWLQADPGSWSDHDTQWSQ